VADERSNQLSVLAKAEFAVVKVIPTGAASFPHHVMASPNGRFVYFGRYNTNTVGVVDTSSDELIHAWPASANPLAKTHAVWITNDGKDLYATNEVANIRREARRPNRRAAVGAPDRQPPERGAGDPDRKTAYVTVRNEDKVKILDLSGDTPVPAGEAAIGVQPDTMQVTNDGKTLVVGLRWIPQLALMDTASLRVRPVIFAGYGISGHQWLSANGQIHVRRAREHRRDKARRDRLVDNDSGDVLDLWPYPGGPWPHGVFYEPEVLRSVR
jgi:hypothetical protein